jgi:arylsulfatase A-like enzyme
MCSRYSNRMKIVYLIISLLVFFLTRLQADENKARPNVLFISVDDLNDFAAFSQCYPDAITPNMDKLAKLGTVFTKAHCQFPLCGPSRASVMSGLQPSTLGYDDHIKDEALEKRAQSLGTELLHTYFKNHGYETLAAGKICHYHVPKGSVDQSGGRGSFDEGTGRLRKNWNQKGTSTDWAMAPERDEDLPDFKAAGWAIEQLQMKHEKPFFLMVGFLRPHVPWYVPEKWYKLYDPAKLTLPPYLKGDLDDVPEMAKRINILPEMPRTDWAIENDQWRKILQAYLACISFTDHQVGRVIEALEASPYKDNTVIVLWSDHGYHMGEKNTFQKHTLWQRSSHVPLLMAGPGIQPDKRCERVVGLIDIYPTLVDACGLPKNPKNEGRSLVPLFKDPTMAWDFPTITGWKEESFALQTERYRYIRYGDSSEELYDHQKDPNEWNNLARQPETAELRKQLSLSIDGLAGNSDKEKD